MFLHTHVSVSLSLNIKEMFYISKFFFSSIYTFYKNNCYLKKINEANSFDVSTDIISTLNVFKGQFMVQ